MSDQSLTPGQARLLFAAVSSGVFMSTMDSSMVNTVLPVLMREFHAPLRLTEWVSTAYLLVVTVCLLVFGRLGDRVGRGRIYRTGLLVFALGSLLCGLAPGIRLLIVFRGAQALGAAMMMATGPALIRSVCTPERLGRGLGLVGVATAMGLLCGPPAGGFLAGLGQWRLLFVLTVPVGLGWALGAGRAFTAVDAFRARVQRPADGPGALLWALGISAWTLALGHGGGTAATALLLGTALTAGALFVRRERNTEHPLLEPALLASPFHGLAVLNALISFVVLFAVLILTPFYLDKVLALDPTAIGWVMTAVPLSVLPASPLAGRLHDRFGSIPVTASGLGLALAGVLLLLRLGPESRPVDASLGLFVLGWGQATFLAPNSASVLGRVNEDDAGAMSGLLATARNLGMLLGITLSGLVFSRIYAWAGGGELRDYAPEHVDAFMSALRGVLALCALLALGALAAAVARGQGAEDGGGVAGQVEKRGG